MAPKQYRPNPKPHGTRAAHTLHLRCGWHIGHGEQASRRRGRDFLRIHGVPKHSLKGLKYILHMDP